MRFLEELDATASAVVSLAERTSILRDRRARDGRALSASTRAALLSMSVRLRAAADRLDEVGQHAAATPDEVEALVARARALGVAT